ncbi:hypothetical protein GS610_05410 [Ruegeria sp. HKCCD6228]|uniref:hypothetical protein n=1 Tax=Ruegeria sp. HKCCD6228 TaxID=2683001 RepID=UPI001490D4BE|nr:hypothetical protein [Ruegeria sp. HKCCD6228]NOD96642.1 hypothetical protein [Ruegeria sp. HKCCD6228]
MQSVEEYLHANLVNEWPEGYPLLITNMLRAFALLEITVSDLIAAEYGMEPLEAATFIGRMELRLRLEKLSQLYKAREEKDKRDMVELVKKRLRIPIENRNIVVHNFYLGHVQEGDQTVVVYGSTQVTRTQDRELQTVRLLNVSDIEQDIEMYQKTMNLISAFTPEETEEQ